MMIMIMIMLTSTRNEIPGKNFFLSTHKEFFNVPLHYHHHRWWWWPEKIEKWLLNVAIKMEFLFLLLLLIFEFFDTTFWNFYSKKWLIFFLMQNAFIHYKYNTWNDDDEHLKCRKKFFFFNLHHHHRHHYYQYFDKKLFHSVFLSRVFCFVLFEILIQTQIWWIVKVVTFHLLKLIFCFVFISS